MEGLALIDRQQMDGQRAKWMDRELDGWTDGTGSRWVDSEHNGWTDSRMDGQKDGWTVS